MSGPVEVEAQPFIDGIVYGEGPRWHEGRLWFTDGFAGKGYSVGEVGDVTVEAAGIMHARVDVPAAGSP
jgi:hypothetical protein